MRTNPLSRRATSSSSTGHGRAYVTAHNKNRLDKPLDEYLTGSNKGTDHPIIRVKPNWY
ncbi:hypothetical protein ABTX60_27505 [Streptomyces sp. NPDC126510]|uniref:hypothetical protein n=1 Tax=Streptomyces sp. NPDC126510 TaxID=3155317 RepID=UPI003319C5E9